MRVKQVVSPRQVARAIGVSEASLKRWCDKGLLRTMRTPGGHRRIPIDSVVSFIRSSNCELVEPELLGLPSTTGQGKTVINRAREGILDALRRGDEQQARRFVMDLYMAGVSACDICDRTLAPVFEEIGLEWQHGDMEVYQERRGCEIIARVLHELRQALPPVEPGAITAIGGTLEDDPYTLPTTMVELVLLEAGCQAVSLGSGHPVSTLMNAMHALKPQLFWLSVSTYRDDQSLVERFHELNICANESRIPFVVGGHALTEPLRRRLEFTSFCDQLRHLVSFAQALPHARATPDTG